MSGVPGVVTLEHRLSLSFLFTLARALRAVLLITYYKQTNNQNKYIHTNIHT